MTHRLILSLILLPGFVLHASAQDPVRDAAERAQTKLEAIAAAGEKQRDAPAPALRTVLTEVEVNALLKVRGPEALPAGISDPEVRLGDDNRLRARAIIDLDAVREAKQRGWRDPLSYVVGSVEVIATGRIIAEQGIGRAELESATVAGLAVPKSVAQELLRFYTATPERPQGFSLDDSFALPAGIHRVIVRRGNATVVQ
jgi:hypothetical protein